MDKQEIREMFLHDFIDRIELSDSMPKFENLGQGIFQRKFNGYEWNIVFLSSSVVSSVHNLRKIIDDVVSVSSYAYVKYKLVDGSWNTRDLSIEMALKGMTDINNHYMKLKG
jgi:hypothetical protein